jgi:hypothetical protein
VLRPVIDSCDLIDLFAEFPEQAVRWVNTDKAHIDFAPSSVRKLLGRDRFDPVHSYFSESGSHPYPGQPGGRPLIVGDTV